MIVIFKDDEYYKKIADDYLSSYCELIDFSEDSEEETRRKWLELRMKGIGGSDVSCIMGHNHFRNRKDIYKSKLFTTIESTNSAIEYGNYFEDFIFNEFKYVYKDTFAVLNYKSIMFRNIFIPYFQASVDGVLVEKETNKVGLLEIKTTQMKKSKWYLEGKRAIPKDYIDQAIHYFNTTNVDFIIFYPKINMVGMDNCEYDSIMLKPRRINREDVLEYMEQVEKECIIFWEEYVMKNIEPSNRICL